MWVETRPLHTNGRISLLVDTVTILGTVTITAVSDKVPFFSVQLGRPLTRFVTAAAINVAPPGFNHWRISIPYTPLHCMLLHVEGCTSFHKLIIITLAIGYHRTPFLFTSKLPNHLCASFWLMHILVM